MDKQRDKEGVPTQGGRNSSVESSMRTIRQSQVRCTLYTFIVEFSTKFVIFEKKDENKQKEPVFGPFILKRSRTLSKNGCFVYFDFEKMKSCWFECFANDGNFDAQENYRFEGSI